MKRVKDIAFFKHIREIREYRFGTFYFFNGLVIGEVNEGITFEWEMGERVINAAKEIFGEHMPIAYISNRINAYYVVPAHWAKFFKNRNQLDFYCVVGHTKGSFTSLAMERIFFKNSIKQFTDLEKAIDWSSRQIKYRRKKSKSIPTKLSANME